MSGICVEKLSCPCGSSDGLQVFSDEKTGQISGYCFVCNTYYSDPYNKTQKESKPVDWTFADVPDRKLTKETCEYFGVQVMFSEETGQIFKHRYPKYGEGGVVGYKIRECPKKFYHEGEKSTMMFGEHQAGRASGKKLFITEGELDAMSVFQVLYAFSKEKYGNSILPAVVSLSNGASGAVKELKQSAKLIDKFEEIILLMDMDEVGQTAAKEITAMYPDKTFIVEMPDKDPNAMLVSGKEATLRTLALTSKKRYKPQTLKTIDELRESVLSNATERGLDWPWPSLNNVTFGIRRPAIYMFGAGSGCVDCDTEFMSPTGWKKISEWSGERVLSYDTELEDAVFLEPVRYIKEEAEYLWHIKTSNGVDQVLCDDHRVLYDTDVRSHLELPLSSVREIHSKQVTGFRGRIRASFKGVHGVSGFPLREFGLRLQVAVNADGYYEPKTNKRMCYVNIKKERKKQRLEWLLERCGLEYAIHKSGEGYSRYYFEAPMYKGFSEEWYACNSDQLRIVAEECLFWDGDCKSKFFSSSKRDADFVQYAITSTGDRASLLTAKRGERTDYIVNVTRKNINKVSFRKTVESSPEFVPYKTKDGYKYCFTVATGALVLRRNGNIFITGNCGKTEVFKELVLKHIKDNKVPVACFFLEEQATHTVKVLAGKIKNKRFHLPDGSWTTEELREAITELESYSKLILFDSSAGKDWESIKNDIRYLVLGEGVRDIFLDHLTALTASADDERRSIDSIMAELGALTEELNCTIYVISHLTRSDNRSKPHEEGGRVRQSDFRGSGSIQFWSHYMFGIERNTQADDADERNCATLRCLKDRLSGNANGVVIPLKFQPATGRLIEETFSL